MAADGTCASFGLRVERRYPVVSEMCCFPGNELRGPSAICRQNVPIYARRPFVDVLLSCRKHRRSPEAKTLLRTCMRVTSRLECSEALFPRCVPLLQFRGSRLHAEDSSDPRLPAAHAMPLQPLLRGAEGVPPS